MRKFVVALMLLLTLAGGAPVSRPKRGASSRVAMPGGPPSRLNDALPIVDLRVQLVAKAIARAHGVDPDADAAPPFPPGPMWRFFIPDAQLFVLEYDALQTK